MPAQRPRARRTAADNPLARYREKRDFVQTPEPRGDAPPRRARAARGVGAPSALRFVVQKHAARRLRLRKVPVSHTITAPAPYPRPITPSKLA